MRPEAVQVVETELRRFAADLKLSDAQKAQLKTGLESAHKRLEEIRASNPDVTRADVVAKIVEARDSLREHVVNFLTPEQLAKWDAGVTKAKTFLGINLKT